MAALAAATLGTVVLTGCGNAEQARQLEEAVAAAQEAQADAEQAREDAADAKAEARRLQKELDAERESAQAAAKAAQLAERKAQAQAVWDACHIPDTATFDPDNVTIIWNGLGDAEVGDDEFIPRAAKGLCLAQKLGFIAERDMTSSMDDFADLITLLWDAHPGSVTQGAWKATINPARQIVFQAS